VIVPTQLVNEGTPLSLCYKAMTYFFLGGLYTTDEYVLCENAASKRYWNLPSPEKLAALQERGLLPKPLPPYKRDFIDYVFGYSLWVLLAVLALWHPIGKRMAAEKTREKLAALKLCVRRVMAGMTSISADKERARGRAHQIYLSLFKEPLPDSDFIADVSWVMQEGVAFDGYLGAVGRSIDARTKALLLQIGADTLLAGGSADSNGTEALRHLAGRLGVKPKDTAAFLNALAAAPGRTAAAL
jgi:hypothetical protein